LHEKWGLPVLEGQRQTVSGSFLLYWVLCNLILFKEKKIDCLVHVCKSRQKPFTVYEKDNPGILQKGRISLFGLIFIFAGLSKFLAD